MSVPGNPAYLQRQRAQLLGLAARAAVPLGFGWLGDDGTVDERRPVPLWITCRMTHVAALGVLAQEPPAEGGPDQDRLRALVAHGVRALTGPLHDDLHGGWFQAVDDHGPVMTAKEAYGHAFVVLAASSAVQTGVDGAEEFLAEALNVSTQYFWEEDTGLVVEEWDQAWTVLDAYRGVNANMHTVEAYLAAGDATGDALWHGRAARIATRVAHWAEATAWRIPEHFDDNWVPRLEHHADQPAHPFRPYGATVGHGFEWARLMLAVAETMGDQAPGELAVASAELYERAVADGWAVDGADGFVYTTDWSGAPVVRERMHWVVTEAIGAAVALHRATGDRRYVDDITRWWAYADTYFVDQRDGSWRHELDSQNRPSSTVWAGRPDVYHAYQAALLPTVPLVPSFARALADRLVAVP